MTPMDSEERQAATFGVYDGVVSVIGFIFGLLIHHSPESAIALGGTGGAISATISMSTGQYESCEGIWHKRLVNAGVMGLATLVGSLIPVWPFFIFGRTTALVIAAFGCLAVAGWIGYQKRNGTRGYVVAYLTLLIATGLTLLIISLIPASA
jgi:VIT1/CCC1 family predicted Fe2+/Mn2+ transporter